MKFHIGFAALVAAASLSFASIAAQAQQVDFGQLRGAVSACSGVAGPAAGQAATCAQWIALTSCIADSARAAGGVTDAGATTCGGLAAQAVTAADEAGRVCAQATATTRTERDQAARNNAELARVRGELTGVRQQLNRCEEQLASRRSTPVTPTPGRGIRLPICLPGARNGNSELWCQTRDGRQLTGDDCREEPRANITRAACLCPENARAVAVGPQVDREGNRLPRGYVCALVYHLETGDVQVNPPGANDPDLVTRINGIDTRINGIDTRLRTVETSLGTLGERVRLIGDVQAEQCGLEPGAIATRENCRPRTAPAAAPAPSSANHAVWLGYASTIRLNGHVSHVGMVGYGVVMHLSERVRMPLMIGVMFGDYHSSINRAIFGYTLSLGLGFRVSDAVELGPRVQYLHFLDLGPQDPRLSGFGEHRGVGILGGIGATFGLGAGFVVDASLLFGVAQSISREAGGQAVEEWPFAIVPTVGIRWQTH